VVFAGEIATLQVGGGTGGAGGGGPGDGGPGDGGAGGDGGGGAPGALCITPAVTPPIVTVPLRVPPPFAATVNRTVPLPCPAAGVGLAIHESLLRAFQLQPSGAVTAKEISPPAAPTSREEGDTS
jgi:hypothetical protein